MTDSGEINRIVTLALDTRIQEPDCQTHQLILVVNYKRLDSLLKAEKLSPAEVSEIMQALTWKISLGWLRKLKFAPSYRLKVAKELSNPLEKFGILLCSTLRITEQLFAYGYCCVLVATFLYYPRHKSTKCRGLL